MFKFIELKLQPSSYEKFAALWLAKVHSRDSISHGMSDGMYAAELCTNLAGRRITSAADQQR
jgi:hypothetical protein